MNPFSVLGRVVVLVVCAVSAVFAFAFAVPPGAAAAAVGHWASPVEVIPGAGDSAVVPEAFVDGGGRSLVLADDAGRPMLAVGDAAGTFAPPVALGPAAGPVTSLDAAPTPDGGLVVAYASGGGAHVVLVGAGGVVGASADLGGTGVDSLAVAVAPDSGAVVVVYRTEEADGSSGLLLRSAARGSTAFRAATTLDAGPPLDSVDVAAGTNGTVAVVYRRLSGRHQVWSVVRGGGVKDFEGPQLLGVGAAQDDLDPRVVIDGGGMIVAAWGNAEGGRYATRGSGDNAWGAAAPLGGGEASNAMDLVRAPSGGTAAAWSGGGVVRSAVRAHGAGGAGFGAVAPVDAFDGPIRVDPAVGVAPDGTTTVVTVRPMSGEIRAVDVGGRNELIGYGGAETATVVGVAATADRTVAVWKNHSGGYSAATRSASAPASQGQGAPPPAPDHAAPKLSFAGRSKRLSFRKAPHLIRVVVRCDEACRVSAGGSLRIAAAARRGRPRVVAPLRPFAGTTLGGARAAQKVTLRLGTATRRALSRSLARGRGAIALVDLVATDAAGNPGRGKVQLSIKPKPRARKRR